MSAAQNPSDITPYTGNYIPVGYKIGHRGQLKKDVLHKSRHLKYGQPIPVGYRIGHYGNLKPCRRAQMSGLTDRREAMEFDQLAEMQLGYQLGRAPNTNGNVVKRTYHFLKDTIHRLYHG
jgi:hypothetical protein